MNADIDKYTASANLGKQATISLGIVLLALAAHFGLSRYEYTSLPKVVNRPIPLNVEDRTLANNAWRYFKNNRLQSTGLVSSAASFPATTMWDIGSQLGGMTAARELGLISPKEFDRWMSQVLTSLVKLPLYRNELPNKAYNAETLMPVSYGELNKYQEIGFSALDLGRLVMWLDIVGNRYPQHAAACKAVTDRWKINRLVKDEQLMGTDSRKGKETWNQEGRLGYEQYAAYSLSKIGVKAPKALDPKESATEVDIYGVKVPADKHDTYHSVQHNYVTSEPYILAGIETGFKALPEDFAARVLQAQQRREKATGKLTTWSEDNLDKAPWFVYNTVFVDRQPWKTIDSEGKDATRFRGSSIKAAVGWHVLFRTIYTEKAYKGMRWLADPKQGIFAGYYEETEQPNRALTLNTNGIILEGLLYAQVGKSLEVWAREGK